MTPAIAARLDEIARKRGASASEIVSQAILAFDSEDAEALAADLMELVAGRLKEAIDSTRRAQREVERTLVTLEVSAQGRLLSGAE